MLLMTKLADPAQVGWKMDLLFSDRFTHEEHTIIDPKNEALCCRGILQRYFFAYENDKRKDCSPKSL